MTGDQLTKDFQDCLAYGRGAPVPHNPGLVPANTGSVAGSAAVGFAGGFASGIASARARDNAIQSCMEHRGYTKLYFTDQELAEKKKLKTGDERLSYYLMMLEKRQEQKKK